MRIVMLLLPYGIKGIFCCAYIFGGIMKGKYSKELCISMLCEMQEKISLSGGTRLPRRSDFSDEEVVAIKAHLGPWPRALEAAELKEKRCDDRAELKREKRIRAKRQKNETRKKAKSDK